MGWGGEVKVTLANISYAGASVNVLKTEHKLKQKYGILLFYKLVP